MGPQTKYISVYVALTLVLLLVGNRYIASSGMYQAKTARIDEHYATLAKYSNENKTEDEALLVIGNSYVNASFRPDKFGSDYEYDIIRFVVSGLPLTDIIAIVEHLPEDAPITSLLVGIGYNYATPIVGNSSTYDRYFTTNPVKSLWFSIPIIRGRSLASTIVKEDVKCIISRIIPPLC